VMAASYMPPPRESGKAAGQGALAAVVASFIGGVINLIIMVIRSAIWSTTTQMGQLWTDLPPEIRYYLRDYGIEPEFIRELTNYASGIGGTTVCGSICCLGGILFAAILGAIGGLIYAAMKSE